MLDERLMLPVGVCRNWISVDVKNYNGLYCISWMYDHHEGGLKT